MYFFCGKKAKMDGFKFFVGRYVLCSIECVATYETIRKYIQ